MHRKHRQPEPIQLNIIEMIALGMLLYSAILFVAGVSYFIVQGLE